MSQLTWWHSPQHPPRGSETTYTPTALDSHAHYMAESQKENRDIQCTVGLWGPALRTGQRCNCTWPENGWAQLVGYIKKYNELGCSVVLSGKEKNQYILNQWSLFHVNMFKKYLCNKHHNNVPLDSSVIIITHKKLYHTLGSYKKCSNLLNSTL